MNTSGESKIMKPDEIIHELNKLAPDITFETEWEPDLCCQDIRQDCQGFDDEDPDNWQAWQSEVRATCIQDGKKVSVSTYLGGTWEKAGDDPQESNPDISGYLPQLLEEAATELGGQLYSSRLRGQCDAAATFLKTELQSRYNEQFSKAS